VSTQIFEPWATNASSSPAGTRVCIVNGTPSVPSVTAASPNTIAIQPGLPTRRTAVGVTTAASSTPTAATANACPSPASPARKKPWSWK